MTTTHSPLHRPVDVGTATPTGTTLVIDASPEECAALAVELAILSIERLHATLHVARWRRSGLKVAGHLEAAVTQACGVTLEPVPETVSEDIEARFLPEGESGLPAPSPELDIAHDEIDPPEAFTGRSVDLGALVAEHLALGLDPYPRKAGVAFVEAVEEEDEDETPSSPFAALAELKGKLGKDH